MKKERRYRRFDLLSTLAVLGCIAVLFFECFFIFELYDRNPARIRQYLAETVEPLFARWIPAKPVPAVKPEPFIQIIPKKGPLVTPEEEKPVSAETGVAPDETEEPARGEPVKTNPVG